MTNRKIKHKSMFIFVLALIYISVIITFLNSCSHSTEDISLYDMICFESDILPIFQTNCAVSGCHDGNAEELRFIDYHSIMNSITPNDPKDSKAYEAVTDTWDEFMPPSPRPPLSKEQRTLLYLWIEQGATNSTCN